MPYRVRFRVAALVSLAALGTWGAPAQSQAARDSLPPTVASSRDVMVRMRDGIRLATDVYLPARNGVAIPGRYPTVLRRTPYDKTGWADAVVEFTSHGYAVVFQDTRGRYKSDGVWHMLSDDGADGVDTCNWIAAQPWSNGKIGMFGGSYEGGTQHALALAGCPHLVTIVPTDAVANPGYAGIRNAGAFELRFFNWIFLYGAPTGSRASRDSATRVALERMRDRRMDYLAMFPIRRGTTPLSLAPEYEDWLVRAEQHGGHDAFWHITDVRDDAARYQSMPVALVGGWYDSWAGNTTANYVALTKAGRGPIHLLMGPWTHGGEQSAEHGQVSFGAPAAIEDYFGAWHVAWFDRWLKGESTGRAGRLTSPVRIFVMGTGDGHKDAKGRLFHGGYWRDERSWPLARARETRYYLHADGHLSTDVPREERASVTYAFDPRDPVPTIGGNISSSPGMMENGGWDQRGNPKIWNWQKPIPLSARPDVVVFRSDPLDRELEVTGELTVELWASSSALDTDFTAKLIDEYPPGRDFPEGFALNLEDGIIRARFREGPKSERLMKPGTPYRFTIRLYPTSNVFKKGHRIRLDVSSSNYPRFDVNPNTGEPLGESRRTEVARNTLLLDRAHLSYITLPVVPTNASDRHGAQAGQGGGEGTGGR